MLVDTLSNRLKTALKIRKITQSELANKTGIPKSTISQYVKGSSLPKLDRIKIISKALNVDGAFLMGYEVDMDGNTTSKFNDVTKNDIQLEWCNEAVGLALKELREKNNVTVEELATKLKRKEKTIIEFEDGRELIPLLTVLRICNIFNYDLSLFEKDVVYQFNKLKKESE